MKDVLIDALLDSLMLVPLLFIMHMLIELMENKAGGRTNRVMGSPLLASVSGLVPQCGFSIIASRLFCNNRIPLGSLIAVYIVSSDEALPILLSNPSTALKAVPLIIIKLAIAIVLGYAINLMFKSKRPEEVANSSKGDTNKDCGCAHTGCNGHETDTKRNALKSYFLHPLMHTLEIFLFVLVINLAMGIGIFYIGEDTIAGFLDSMYYLQPLFAAIVGLIPNCASSVLITQMYSMGHIGLGGAVAGLTVNVGLGYTVLIKEHKNKRQAVLIILFMFVLSVVLGSLVNLF